MQRWTPTWLWDDIDDERREPRVIMEARDDGNWVKRSDAAEVERRLALAVAEAEAARVLLWPGGGYTLAKPDGQGRDDCQRYEDARIATDADPVLRAMIEKGGGEG